METLEELAKTGSNVVVMAEPYEDGSERTVDFGKRGRIKKSVFFEQLENGRRKATLQIDVCDGSTHYIDLDDSNPAANLLEMALHGAFQKISDSITKCESPEDIGMTVDTLVATLNKGAWPQREKGEEGISGIEDLLEAIIRTRGESAADKPRRKAWIMDNIKGLNGFTANPDFIKALKSMHSIKTQLAAIAEEKAAAKRKRLEAVKGVTEPEISLDM